MAGGRAGFRLFIVFGPICRGYPGHPLTDKIRILLRFTSINLLRIASHHAQHSHHQRTTSHPHTKSGRGSFFIQEPRCYQSSTTFVTVALKTHQSSDTAKKFNSEVFWVWLRVQVDTQCPSSSSNMALGKRLTRDSG